MLTANPRWGRRGLLAASLLLLPIPLLLLPRTALAQEQAVPTPALPSPPSALPIPPPATAAEQASLDQAALAQDDRLTRAVTLDVVSVPLDEFLQDVSAPGMRLSSAAPCADLKLQVRLKNRPVRALMTALAEMLPGRWVAKENHSGYILFMKDEAVKRRSRWWDLFLGERERALKAQRAAILQAMQTPALRRASGGPSAGLDKQQADEHDFFTLLPAALQQSIADDLDETPYYGGEVSYGGDMEASGISVSLTALPPQAQDMVRRTIADYSSLHGPQILGSASPGSGAADLSRGSIEFDNGGFVVMAIPRNIPAPPMSLSALPSQEVNTLAMMLNQVPLTQQVLKMGKAAPAAWKELAAYQQSRVWPDHLPPKIRADNSGISRAATQEWLADSAGIEFVSDYYSHGGHPMSPTQKRLKPTRPLSEELNEMAARRDVSWKKNADGLYLFRNNRWYRDDDLEVPMPLLRRWFGILVASRDKLGRASAQSAAERAEVIKRQIDWQAEVIGTLTPWQINNGLMLFQPEETALAGAGAATVQETFGKAKIGAGAIGIPENNITQTLSWQPPFSHGARYLMRHLKTAQFYTGLDEASRAALLEGHLSFASLRAEQQQQAFSLSPELRAAVDAAAPGDPSPVLVLRPKGDPLPKLYWEATFPMQLSVASPPVEHAAINSP